MTPSRLVPAALGGVLLALAPAPASAAQGRATTVVGEISAFNASLPPEARAEKSSRMKESVLAFYRGTNHLFWKDLGGSPLLLPYGGVPATRTWLSGDAHPDNTGAFDDDQGDIVFALNDFDEAVIGDYQLDVWRMAIGLVLVARERGVFDAAKEGALVDAFTEAYLDTLAGYADNGGENTRKFMAHNTSGLLDEFLEDVAASNSRRKLLERWTVKVNGARRFGLAGQPDLAAVPPAVDADLRARMGTYRSTLGGGDWPTGYFGVKDVAQRLHAGLGSLGTLRYYVLIEGASASPEDDRVLEVKAQRAPSAWPYLAPEAVSQTRTVCGDTMALRTVLAAKALGYRVDDHLGWVTLADGLGYSVRELSPWRAAFPTERLDTVPRFKHLAEQWGQVLATQHARADRDWNPAVLPTSLDGEVHARTDGHHADFRAHVRALATDYATQVRLDYESFRASP